jgi:hypothetical protein
VVGATEAVTGLAVETDTTGAFEVAGTGTGTGVGVGVGVTAGFEDTGAGAGTDPDDAPDHTGGPGMVYVLKPL